MSDDVIKGLVSNAHSDELEAKLIELAREEVDLTTQKGRDAYASRMAETASALSLMADIVSDRLRGWNRAKNRRGYSRMSGGFKTL